MVSFKMVYDTGGSGVYMFGDALLRLGIEQPAFSHNSPSVGALLFR
jgi:hypothetical protein